MTKGGNIAAIVISAIVLAVVLVLVFRRRKYSIQEGELQGEDAINTVDLMSTWDSKSDEVIAKLHPKARKPFTDFLNDLNGQGIKYRLYSGFRSFQEQAELYGKGRTAAQLTAVNVDPKYAKPAEKIVTNAKPGTSFHNYGLAGDGVEIKDGVALWKSPNEQKIVATASKYGLFWGGNFTSLKDTPHFEIQSFGTVSQLLTIYNSGKIDTNGYLIV